MQLTKTDFRRESLSITNSRGKKRERYQRNTHQKARDPFTVRGFYLSLQRPERGSRKP